MILISTNGKPRRFLILLIIIILLCTSLYAQEKPSLGIMCRFPQEGALQSRADSLSEGFLTAIHRYGSEAYQVIARNKRGVVLQEHNETLHNIVDFRNNPIKMGEIKASEYLAVATFAEDPSGYHVIAHIINVSTTDVKASSRGFGETPEELDKAVSLSVAHLFGHDPLGPSLVSTTLFSSIVPGTGQLMNADGTGQTNLTNHSADDGRPDW